MTEQQFFIFVNFDNDLEDSSEISNPQLHQIKTDKNELDEEYTIKNISLHAEIINVCDVIKCFLEIK